ncbi:MAG TPA: spore germination protein [Clostridia bacterium]|nr:spore germination protein [Clostridia bacterium]
MIDIEQTLKELNEIFLGSSDFVVRKFSVAGISMAFVLIDGLTDKNILNRDLLCPLLSAKEFAPPYADALQQTISYSDNIGIETTSAGLSTRVAQGDVALIIDKSEELFVLSLREYSHRSIAEPPTENINRGPREGFIEDMKVNTSMLRRKLRTPNLVVETIKVGRFSNTGISVCHLHGIADDNIVNKVKERISKIDIDGIIDSSYVAQFLEAEAFSFFSDVAISEKPDVVAAKMLEGRLCIIVDGSPVVLTLPYVIFEDLQDGSDYYSNSWRASMVRFLRMVGAFLSILLPGTYVALESYQYKLLPLKFVISILNAVKGIPFTPAIEMLLVVIIFEVMNQASIRMPRIMGVSLSIVGAIVLGETAVNAGLISSPTVLITALAVIGKFCIPDQEAQISLLRILFLLISAVLGLYGILIGIVVLIGYMASLNNYGTPFLAPIAPLLVPDIKDTIIKSNLKRMKKRPFSIPTNNRTRQSGK